MFWRSVDGKLRYKQPNGGSPPLSAIFLLVILILNWLNPSEAEVTRQHKKQDEAVAYLQGYLETALRSEHEIRLKPDGGDLKVYVAKSDFESIAYPDHEEFLTSAGKVWCGRNAEGVLPSLSIYDIRTGEKFGKYSCTLSRVS